MDHRVGRFELADQGTLFLDEVAELSPAAQAKLLRVIQAGEFERLGSSETIRVNVRIIAATHQDLAWAIREGRFRADLHYRLAVFPIEVPPLRVRRDDIPLLVWHIVRRKQAKLGRNIDSVPQDIMERLMAHDWPGNVRELENVIERALILASDGTLRLGFGLGPCPAAPPADTQACDLRQVEREHILRVLQECDWKVKGRGNAAERLKLTVSTLRYRMKKLGLHPPPRVLPVV